MATTIKIVYRKDKINAQGEAPVCIRITKDRKANYITTTVRIEPRHWDDKAQRIKRTYVNSAQANSYLDKLRLDYEAKVFKEQSENAGLSSRALKEKVIGNASTSFFEVANSLLSRYKSAGKVSTHDTFKATINKVREFIKSDNLMLQDIDSRFLAKFETYLRDILGNCTNTVHKDMRIIRRVFNAAYKQGLIEHKDSPFHRYEIKAEKTVKAFLSKDELKRWEGLQLDPGSRLDLHRNMFQLSVYTGLRVSDVLLLRWVNFTGTHLQFTIRKTTTQHSIKLPNAGLAILKKYKPDEDKPTAFIFDMLPLDLDMSDPVEVDRRISASTAYINKNLKTLAKKAVINKKISFHCARHSFATLALEKGMGIAHVSKLLAHSSVKETEIYAKLVSKELDHAMEKFNE